MQTGWTQTGGIQTGLHSLSDLHSLKAALVEGVHAIDLTGTPICKESLVIWSATLSRMFGDTYLEQGQFVRQARLVWDYVQEHGWSHERFVGAVKRFQERKFYSGPGGPKENWQLHDFIEVDAPRDLHDYAWALAENAKEPGAMWGMEQYRITVGQESVLLWRYRALPPLPFERVFPKE